MSFIRIRPNMQLSTWSVATSMVHANFKHSVFDKSQHPHNTAVDVLNRVIITFFRVGVLLHLSVCYALSYFSFRVNYFQDLLTKLPNVHDSRIGIFWRGVSLGYRFVPLIHDLTQFYIYSAFWTTPILCDSLYNITSLSTVLLWLSIARRMLFCTETRGVSALLFGLDGWLRRDFIQTCKQTVSQKHHILLSSIAELTQV